jgi:hypothetical protein
MSGIRELHHYQAVCEQCQAEGPVVMSNNMNDAVPPDWGYRTTGGWGMYNSHRTHLYCAKCVGEVT